VTIAIGLLATDGIVIAADTQTGITDYLKMSYGKIAFGRTLNAGKPAPNFAITGAGNSPYLEAIRQSEMDQYFKRDLDTPIAEVENGIRQRIDDFYSRHVAPFASSPGYPDVSLLIAAHSGNKRAVWYTEKNLLVPCMQYAAVGAGTMYARILLHKLWAEFDLREALLLAAYVIYHVKECVDGCGHDSQVVFLQPTIAGYIHPDAIRSMEQIFRKQHQLEAHALRFVFSTQENTNTLGAVSKSLRVLRRDVGAILTEAIR
jgi:hypothetical protein